MYQKHFFRWLPLALLAPQPQRRPGPGQLGQTQVVPGGGEGGQVVGEVGEVGGQVLGVLGDIVGGGGGDRDLGPDPAASISMFQEQHSSTEEKKKKKKDINIFC